MKKVVAVLLATLLLTVFLISCGNSGDSSASYRYSTGNSGGSSGSAPMAPTASSAPDAGGGYYEGADDYLRDAEYDYLVSSQSKNDSETSSVISGVSSVSNQPDNSLSEKIIYRVYSDIETIDFDNALKKVTELMSTFGAFFEDTKTDGKSYRQTHYGMQTYRSASYVIRVPKSNLDGFANSLESIGNVVSKQSNAENITSQFYDTQSRLNSYRIQEERLLAMLDKTETVSDMIEIESRLSDVRYSIESHTTTLKNWQSQVDYSTLTLFISEVEKLTEETPIHRTYWQQMSDDFGLTLRRVGVFFTELFKWIVVNSPILVILIVIAVVIILLIRRGNRRREARRVEMYNATQPAFITQKSTQPQHQVSGNDPVQTEQTEQQSSQQEQTQQQAQQQTQQDKIQQAQDDSSQETQEK